MIILLVVFGPRHAGLGMIGAGLYMGFSSLFIPIDIEYMILVPFIVAIGYIYIMFKTYFPNQTYCLMFIILINKVHKFKTYF